MINVSDEEAAHDIALHLDIKPPYFYEEGLETKCPLLFFASWQGFGTLFTHISKGMYRIDVSCSAGGLTRVHIERSDLHERNFDQRIDARGVHANPATAMLRAAYQALIEYPKQAVK